MVTFPGSDLPPACLLCGGKEHRQIRQISHADLNKAWGELGVRFSPEASSRLAEAGQVGLRECRGCGFRFFHPQPTGNAAFYADLQQQLGSYYVNQRPEFLWALKVAREFAWGKALDLGCGHGAFLDLDRNQGLATRGLELNVQAAEHGRKKGHQVYAGRLSDFSRDHPDERFDLITAFQVVEHVENPIDFLRMAAARLQENGGLVIAVPNEHGIQQLCPWDPHQWPPHHLTRWRRQDLQSLGRRCQLEVVRTGADPLLGLDARHFWLLHNRLALVLGKKRYPGGDRLARLLAFVYRKSGCKYILPHWGSNIYVLYKKRNVSSVPTMGNDTVPLG